MQDIEQDVVKEDLSRQLHQGGSAVSRYKQKVLGNKTSYLRLLQFELAQIFCANLGGGLGYLLRKLTFASLFQSCGSGLILGKGIIIRKPGNISLGSNIAIDDQTLLDGGTGADSCIRIGNNCFISKGSVIQAKTGYLDIGDGCDIGAHVFIGSIGGIVLGSHVLIAGNCYIGGARYHLESTVTPIMHQGIYSRGPITIGTGTWLGASVTILDGVTIGENCVIGAGSLVTKDIPNYATAVGSPARVIHIRDMEGL